MRSSIRQKLSALLLLLVLFGILAACSQLPQSQSVTSVVNSSQKLVVYIVGYGEQLGDTDANGYGKADTFFNSKGIQPNLQQQKTGEFKNATSMVYSYTGIKEDGKPEGFSCDTTFSNTILTDEYYLKTQVRAYISAHHGTQVYLVGHSLGGVIAFAYMADMIETHGSNVLDKYGSVLSGVSINDSPLGGVEPSFFYQRAAGFWSHWKCTPHPSSNVVQDFEDIYQSATDKQHLGETASISQVILRGKIWSNQTVAEIAAKDGVAIIVSGNSYDLMWQPDLCDAGPNFLSTQYLSEKGKIGNGALYVRDFQAGFLLCREVVKNRANHFEVTTNGSVEQAIWEAFTGRDVTVLNPVVNGYIPAGIPTTTPAPNFSPFVGDWYAHAQQLVVTADGKGVYTGRVFVWCVDYQGNTVNQPPCDGGGYQGIHPNQNALITFNSVIGDTASGTIMPGGTGMRSQDDNRTLIPIGSKVTVTLNPSNNTLNVSNGMLLCGPQAIKSNLDLGCNSGA